MKVIDSNPVGEVPFGEVEVGAVFIYDECIYVKIAHVDDKNDYNAFDLEHNLLDQLDENYMVVPRKATVTLE